jgi:ABC-type uncharacterized transport system substrate-binding protein
VFTRNTTRRLSVVAIFVGVLSVCGVASAGDKKKILFVDSYHEGYAWSDGLVQGAKKAIGDKYEFKVFRMDTKRKGSEDDKKAAAKRVKQEVEAWKPDVMIAADDNSSKYVVVPFYKDTDLPVVFCGINWDASAYGFPCRNVTGMLEVSVIKPLMETLRKHAKGNRVGFLGKENETDQKEALNLNKKFDLKLTKKFINTFDEWKTAYKELQDKVDMLIVVNNAGITGWDDKQAKEFVLANTKIPSGSCHDFIAPFVLVTYAKLATEQGAWAANTAIKILEGKSPKDIPVASNEKGQFYVNMPLANKLEVKFSLDTLKAAKVIQE